MKKITPFVFFCFFLVISFTSCHKNKDVVAPQEVEIQDFIWRGMNFYYLWKDQVPNLNNSKNDNQTSYTNYLNSYDPASLFESLIFDRRNTDKWSWIVDDYIALENQFQGISKSNGVEYGLVYETGSNSDIFGYIRYILPNSDAEAKNVVRGQIFDAINGIQLTVNNYRSLLSNDTYVMNFADFNNGNPISNGTSVELSKFEYQENPVYLTTTIDVNNTKIGYLMYNGFTSSFDQELNSAFAQLKNSGATELVLDLRYNGGGSVRTASYLASMITGQFNSQLLTKERWNNDLQEWFETNHPDWLLNNFKNEILKEDANGNVVLQEAINSLNLNTVYVITTNSSASASELVINGLKPYINVITIGSKTAGKYVASITVYDSENFDRENANPNHTWAMQPIVLEEVNKLGENDKDGFDPTFPILEDFTNMSELGNINEPLLAEAISKITASGKFSKKRKNQLQLRQFSDSKELKKIGNGMYIDKKLPTDIIE